MIRDFSFTVEMNEDTKTYNVSIPTAGQLIQIENLKAVYSANNYGGINASGTVGANYALDLVDMNAYLTILCPKLIESLIVDDLFSLDVFDLAPIKDAYDKQFIPWINDWQSALRKLNKKETTEEPEIEEVNVDKVE